MFLMNSLGYKDAFIRDAPCKWISLFERKKVEEICRKTQNNAEQNKHKFACPA